MPIKNTVTVDEVIEVLNRALKSDHEAITKIEVGSCDGQTWLARNISDMKLRKDGLVGCSMREIRSPIDNMLAYEKVVVPVGQGFPHGKCEEDIEPGSLGKIRTIGVDKR